MDLESRGIVLSVLRKQRQEADLRLCFRICRLLVIPRGGSYIKCSQVLGLFEIFIIIMHFALCSHGIPRLKPDMQTTSNGSEFYSAETIFPIVVLVADNVDMHQILG